MDSFDQWVGLWLPLVVCTIGIVGNSISLYVLSCDKGHNSLFLALKALVLSDILLLLAAILQQILPMWTAHADCESYGCLHVIGYVRIYSWPVVCTCQTCSAWLTLLISTERYMAICHSQGAQYLHRLPNIRLAILAVVLAALVFNVPKFFEYVAEVERVDGTNLTVVVVGDTPQRYNLVYRYLYNTVLHGLFVFALPILFLLGLNTCVVLHIRHALKFSDHLNRQTRRKLKATQVPIGIVVVFCLCNTLAFTSFVLDAVFIRQALRWLQCFMGISNMFVMLNAAVNFVIFYLLGRKFKLLCRQAIDMCLHRSDAQSIHQESPLLLRRFKRQESQTRESSPLHVQCVTIPNGGAQSATSMF